MADEVKSWWAPIVHALTHTVVGTLIFLIIATAAVVLGQFVQWLQGIGTSAYVLAVLTFLEYAIVTVDAVGYLLYLVTTAYQAWKEL
ncbi:MAG: hypothetical protein AB7L71_02625 [Vicinamibacterales bacterium]